MNPKRMLLWPVLAVMLLGATATGAAESKSKLRSQIVKAENEFFSLYNKLNTDHQYDMVCRMERATGSNFDSRVCQPRYMLTAKESAASERMRSAVSSPVTTGQANGSGQPNVGAAVGDTGTVNVQARQEAMRKNMLDVLQKSPELQELGRKRDELQASLDALNK
jgi:hypothetical protein